MHRKKHLQQLSEVRLKQDQVLDIWDAFYALPYAQQAHDAFINMVLGCPPEVKMRTLKWARTNELDFILEQYLLPFLRDSYKWFKCIGILPWYKKKLRGSEYKIPVIPPIDAGYITTYLNEQHEQHFRYYFNGEQDPYKKMQFERSPHIPGLDGSIRSSLSGLLWEWRTSKIVRQSVEIATYGQAHQQHVFEYHPGKQMTGDDNMETLESYGDTIAGTVMAQQERLNEYKMDIRRDQLQWSVAAATAANQHTKMRYGNPGAFMRTDTQSDQWERMNSNLLDRAIPLRPDFSYKPVPAPHVTANLDQIMARIDRLACLTFDIPLNLIESTGGKTAANVQGNLRFLNERMKEWNATFTRFTKKIFLMLYGKVIQKGLSPYMFSDEEIEVYMPCTPIASLADLQMIFDRGYMEKQTAAEHIFNVLGLPHSDITLGPDQMLLLQKKPPSSSSKVSSAAVKSISSV